MGVSRVLNTQSPGLACTIARERATHLTRRAMRVLENRQTITLAKHAVFDPGQLLLDSAGPGLGGKQLQRRAITQRAFGLAQPSRGIRGSSSEDLLGAGRDARDPDIVTYLSCSH
jgi:hypothetical protein